MARRLVAWDTETALIAPGLPAPPLTCMSVAEEIDGEVCSALYSWREAREVWLTLAQDPDVVFVGHHIAYDHGVLAAEWPDLLPLIFQLYREDRILDTMLRQKLLDNAKGMLGGFKTDKNFWVKLNYNLADLTKRHLKKQLDKDTWRLRYGQLRDVPLDQWEPGARDYAIEDAVSTLQICLKQEEVNQEQGLGRWLEDECRQSRHAWWIHLMASWGLRTNEEGVERLVEETQDAYKTLAAVLQDPRYGFVRKDGTRDVNRVRGYMIAVMGGKDKCRPTEKGGVSLDEEACNASGDPLLEAYTELSKLKNVLSKDVPALRLGKHYPIHSRFNTILDTGRTSSSKPNVQNIRRLPGIRECFVPRPGHVFAVADYDGLELRTLGQICLAILGHSALAEALNAGRDPHLEIATHRLLLNISYEEALAHKKEDWVDQKRQMGKVVNFGCPGGLGAKTLVVYAKANYGVTLTEEEARMLKQEVWAEKWPEMPEYLAFISKGLDPVDDTCDITQYLSGRVRGRCRYTQACNTLFQGLGADATKSAGFLIAQACYVDQSSPLFGCRIVNYLHDEYILETPEEKGHEVAMELARLMVEGAAPWLPDVPPLVSEPMIMRYWSKKAKQVWKDGIKGGRLVPWVA